MTFFKLGLVSLLLLTVIFNLRPKKPQEIKLATCLLTRKIVHTLAESCQLEEVACQDLKVVSKNLNPYIAQNEFNVSFSVKDDVYFWDFIKKLHKNTSIVILSKEIFLERFPNKRGQRPLLKGRYHFICFNVSLVGLSS